MVASYIELSSALARLAESGQVNTGAAIGIGELADVVALAPAACLDYFNTEYMKLAPNSAGECKRHRV